MHEPTRPPRRHRAQDSGRDSEDSRAIQRTEHLVRGVIAGGCLAGLALSPHLWLSTRYYPLTPVFSFLKRIPPPADFAIYLILLTALAIAAIARRPAIFIGLFIAGVIVMVAFDQSRLTPWLYQYVIMLAVLGIAQVRARGDERYAPALNTCRAVLVCIYFWSGAQKLGADFPAREFPWLIRPLGRLLPYQAAATVHKFGFLVPIIEMSIALGLLVPGLRRLAVCAGAAMHGSILLEIGPFGLKYNSVVWPWNVTMVLLLFLLFWNYPAVSLKDIIWPRYPGFHAFTILMVGIAPALSFFDMWDHELSFALYCDPRNEAELFVSNSLADRLPRPILEHVYVTNKPGINRINIPEWSLSEMNVGNYPEPRIYRSVARSICVYERESSDLRLVTRRSRVLFLPDKEISYGCRNLLE